MTMPPADGRLLRRSRTRALGTLAFAALACLFGSATSAGAHDAARRFAVPRAARQLIVVSSPTHEPSDHLASLRTFQRASASAPWQPVFPAWRAEIGSGELRNVRREGDRATPTGVYPLGLTIYGNEPNPGGLHTAYHHLACGDWWDEDPYSSRYNRFVHVSCGTTPPFAGRSEALWTETTAYPYFAVINYNEDPTISGPKAPGSGIFLHAWVEAPTAGCVALHAADLLHVLRWLQPADHPFVEIGTDSQLGRLSSRSAQASRLASGPLARRRRGPSGRSAAF
jgi:L,D-peptidoglycan transpeptidase YkuD (ErfK/YbiS/YcfS/YnhG family)